MYYLYCDGSCTPNPGKGYYQYLLLDKEINEREIFRADIIGETTNNVAEYKGLIEGLKKCLERNIRGIPIFMDSKLVVECVNGRWKVKKEHLKPLCKEARELLLKVGGKLQWVPNTENLVDQHAL